MPNLKTALDSVINFDKQFVGTIAFRNEEIHLPDNSKMALGMDDGHWILVYQKSPGARFQAFSFDAHSGKLLVDQKAAAPEDYKNFKAYVNYFLANAKTEDLVTILPGEN